MKKFGFVFTMLATVFVLTGCCCDKNPCEAPCPRPCAPKACCPTKPCPRPCCPQPCYDQGPTQNGPCCY